jgi:hypothetical protein
MVEKSAAKRVEFSDKRAIEEYPGVERDGRILPGIVALSKVALRS